jgi:hypothetical protein
MLSSRGLPVAMGLCAHVRASGPAQRWGEARSGATMRLFKRKPDDDEDVMRCPSCEERVPEGAVECAMCGRDLRAVVAEHSAGQERVERTGGRSA